MNDIAEIVKEVEDTIDSGIIGSGIIGGGQFNSVIYKIEEILSNIESCILLEEELDKIDEIFDKNENLEGNLLINLKKCTCCFCKQNYEYFLSNNNNNKY